MPLNSPEEVIQKFSRKSELSAVVLLCTGLYPWLAWQLQCPTPGQPGRHSLPKLCASTPQGPPQPIELRRPRAAMLCARAAADRPPVRPPY